MNALNRPALRIVRDEEAELQAAPFGCRIRHGLVCLDGSRASEASLSFAAMLAEAFAAEITLLHVLAAPQFASAGDSRPDVLEWEIARREADQYLERARTLLEACGTSRVRTIVSQGAPSDRIAATLRDIGADLTIVGADATSRGPALGETAQRIIASTSGSVLVARETASTPPKRIVVPLDGSTRAELVLPTAIALAQAYDASITLAHVVCERSSALTARPGDIEIARQLTAHLKHDAESYLDRVRGRQLREVSDVRRVVSTRKDERRALLDIVAEAGGDLVVLAAHGATCDVDDRFGGVASHLLTHARVPLLVLQDVAASPTSHDVTHAPRRPSMIRRREEA